MRKQVFFLFITVVSLYACKKGSNDPAPPPPPVPATVYKDTLSDANNAYLETLGVPTPALNELLDYYGNNFHRGRVSDLVEALVSEARSYCAMKESVIFPSEGSDKPEQNGLAYSRGQRVFNERRKPEGGNAIHKSYFVYGLDCSGFAINMFQNCGVNVSTGASVGTFETELRTALQNSTDYKDLSVKNLGKIDKSQLRSGDLMLWFLADGDHMGIVGAGGNGTQVLFQANGTGFPATHDIQKTNWGLRRGVRTISIPDATGGSYWGDNYIILRVQGGITLSNPSLYPKTELYSAPAVCGGYVICDFECPQDSWDMAKGAPTISINGIRQPVNGVLLERITNNWGFTATACTNNSPETLKFYETVISGGMVKGKVKVLGDFGTCDPPYGAQYFTFFKFTLIHSTLPGHLQTGFANTYTLASNYLTARQ